jgi:hypothetical protein
MFLLFSYDKKTTQYTNANISVSTEICQKVFFDKTASFLTIVKIVKKWSFFWGIFWGQKMTKNRQKNTKKPRHYQIGFKNMHHVRQEPYQIRS